MLLLKTSFMTGKAAATQSQHKTDESAGVDADSVSGLFYVINFIF